MALTFLVKGIQEIAHIYTYIFIYICAQIFSVERNVTTANKLTCCAFSQAYKLYMVYNKKFF